MKTVRVVYYGASNNKKVAIFKILNDDTLELIESKDFVSPVLKPEAFNNNRPNINQISNKIGIGEIVASVTKIFGFKPCAPCDKRRKYLNKITPNWLSKIIAKAYK